MGLVTDVSVSDEAMRRLARVLYATGKLLHRSGGVDSAVADRRRLSSAMGRLRRGDLVVVVDRFDPDGVGRLERIEGVWPHERYVIRPLHRPDAEQGWQNCVVLALPDDAHEWLRVRAQREMALETELAE